VFARPMHGAALAEWLTGFQAGRGARRPFTAAGALAAALVWEEQFLALPPGSLAWQEHAASGDAAAGYPDGQASPLHDSQAAMLAAAIGGPADAVYRQARDAFLGQLIERVRAEERCIETLLAELDAVNVPQPMAAAPLR
jgi:hypothetical protein